jgi:PmbA protein
MESPDLRFADDIVALALREGADEAEVFVRSYRSLSVEVRNGAVDTLESAASIGYGVRVFKDHRIGFSYATDPALMAATTRQAVEAARHTEPDAAYGLASPDRPYPAPGLYDAAIASLDEPAAIDLVKSLEAAALAEDRRITRTRGASGSFTVGTTRILSSKGVDASAVTTAASASLMAVAESDGESQMGWDYRSSRRLNDIPFPAIGKQAAQRALQLLGSRTISPFRGSVLFDPSVAVDFLGILAAALSAESVLKGKSMFAGKIGQQVISPLLTIRDNGLLDWKAGTRPFDDEGMPVEDKVLIEQGVLKGYLHNTYTARKDGTRSTGNGRRGGYASLPGVGPTNLYLEPAGSGADNGMLLAMIDKGILVTETMGMHTANPISGEFSVGVSGLLIERGAAVHPVREAIISGTIPDLFSRIVMVGEELCFYGNIGSPALLAAELDISG